jgi:hypothetical protein
MMFIRDDHSEQEKLRNMGFSPAAIRRLCILRSRYAKNEMDQPALDKHHLEFARWLVLHHKLTEEIN